MEEKAKTYNYRVRFSKHGAIKYIGHLDVMRYFQKLLRRAEINVSYTKGFSPHAVTTFAQPLGVGIESDGEYMDLKVETYYTCAELKDRINKASVPEIQAISVVMLPDDIGNAMASVAAAEYKIGFKNEKTPEILKDTDSPKITSFISEFLNRDSIILVKEGKAGLREVDIKDRIYEFSWNDEENCFHAMLDASSGYNIKPSALMDLFLTFHGDILPENSLMIYRADTYTRNENENLVSMESVGRIV